LICLDFHHPQAWHLCDPNAGEVFKALRKSGVKLAIVSNFDTRLRPLLRALNCDDWFDAVAVSAEVCKLFFFSFLFCILCYQFVLLRFLHFSPHPLMHTTYLLRSITMRVSSLQKYLWDKNSGNKS
jgi:hypothetical protein